MNYFHLAIQNYNQDPKNAEQINAGLRNYQLSLVPVKGQQTQTKEKD